MDITQLPLPSEQSTASHAVELRLAGRFDAHEVDTFRAILGQILDGSGSGAATRVLVSLAEVEFIDSTALAELVRGMKHCRERDGDLILVSPSDPVRVILELTRLDLAFTIE